MYKYSMGNKDIYACEPQYYVGNTYINAGDVWFNTTFLCQASPPYEPQFFPEQY